MLSRELSIAIVGNGPNEIGRGKGAEIDSHDVVVRCNNYEISDAYREDYGVKTTHWIYNGYPDVRARDISMYCHTYCTTPVFDERFILNMAPQEEHDWPDWKQIARYMRTGNMSLIPWAVIDRVLIRSAGILFLAWLYFDRLPDPNLNGVDTYGFSFFEAPQHHYWSDEPDAILAHSPEAEKALYSAMRYGVWDGRRWV
jgi:hypothetical protein